MQAQVSAITETSAGPEPTLAEYVMTDAVEGSGIAYWAEIKNVKRAGGYVTSFQVRDAGLEGPRESEKWVTVNERKVNAAAQKLRDGNVEAARRISAQFCGKEWEYDSEGVDCIIQAIAFGKLIFG